MQRTSEFSKSRRLAIVYAGLASVVVFSGVACQKNSCGSRLLCSPGPGSRSRICRIPRPESGKNEGISAKPSLRHRLDYQRTSRMRSR